MESMSKFIFTAPEWPASMIILCILGLFAEILGERINSVGHFGFFCFIIPGIVAFLLTGPVIKLFGSQTTLNRSALLSVSCTIFSLIITMFGLIVLPDLIDLCFGISLGLIFGLRLLVLASIADYRMFRMIIPAIIQSLVGYAGGILIFANSFLLIVPIILLFFGLGFSILIWLIERPLYRAFHIRGLEFINAFIAHLTDGSKSMENFFKTIGVEAFVPQVSIFFRQLPEKGSSKDIILTIPNVHPGPMGEIGGGNLPAILKEEFSEEIMVTHGCATHDFNLVSESEIDKIVEAVNGTRDNLVYSKKAGKSERVFCGSVSILYQKIGDVLLMVSTRSPDKTEDLNFCIGHAIMCEGHKVCSHVGFIDAHNSIGNEIDAILPGTKTAYEYFTAAVKAMDLYKVAETSGFSVGYHHTVLPYTREQGFGDTGLQTLIVDVMGQKTAYVLLDGNNMVSGLREDIRQEVLKFVDDVEIMTTDTHVVNTISGKNPVGMQINSDLVIAHVVDCVKQALNDLVPSEAAGSTADCNGVIIFGSESIAQFAGIVNTILIYIVPISGAILLLSVVLSTIAYMVVS